MWCHRFRLDSQGDISEKVKTLDFVGSQCAVVVEW